MQTLTQTFNANFLANFTQILEGKQLRAAVLVARGHLAVCHARQLGRPRFHGEHNMQEIEHNLSLEYVTRIEAGFQWNAFPSKSLLAKVRKYTGLVVRGCVLTDRHGPYVHLLESGFH